MKKFAVFSGFLGSGKTTTMMALTELSTDVCKKTAMISNDLGGEGLADNRFAQLSGCNASELTDECICYQNENLAERITELYDSGCDLVISDIPGFGVGALEHVYHGLNEKYPHRFALAPFTVLTEPRTVELLRSGNGSDMAYLLDTQLVEADLIVLNKCDLISEEQRAEDVKYLRQTYPEADVICTSAATGEGLEDLSNRLMEGVASMRRPNIGYGGESFMSAMGKLSEYYVQYRAVVCCNDFDGTAYLKELASSVQKEIRACSCEIPHLKLLAWEPEGDFGKVDLLGTYRPIEITRHFQRPCTEIAVVLNASAVCPNDKLDKIITNAVSEVSGRFQLEITIFRKECFGMVGD